MTMPGDERGWRDAEIGIPIPCITKRHHRHGSGLKGAIARLNVGESIFLADREGIKTTAAAMLGAHVTSIRKSGEVPATHKYVTRTVEGGGRVWRFE